MTSFCPFGSTPFGSVLGGLCYILPSNRTQLANFRASVPFLPKIRDNTIDTLISGLNNYVFLDKIKDPGAPFYDSKVDIISELQNLKMQNYDSDYDFQEAVSTSIAKLHDKHTVYSKPNCYNFIDFALPFNMKTKLGSSGEVTYSLELANNVAQLYDNITPGFKTSLLEFMNLDILTINDKAPGNALLDFSDESNGYNDKNVRFNEAVNFFCNRSPSNYNMLNTPLGAFNYQVTFTFKGISKSLVVPFLWVTIAQKFPFSYSQCLKKTATVASTSSSKTVQNNILREMHVNNDLMEKKYPHIRDFMETKQIRQEIFTSGSFGASAKTVVFNNPSIGIECWSFTDALNRNALIMRIPTFAPNNTNSFLFLQAYQSCLESPYDVVVIDVSLNPGGVIPLGMELARYLSSNLFNLPIHKLYHQYDIPHTKFYDLVALDPANSFGIGFVSVRLNSTNDNSFTFKSVYGNGIQLQQGDVLSLRSNRFCFNHNFVLNPIRKQTSNPNFKPVKSYDNSNLYIITDGRAGSAASIFTKLLFERKLATFVGLGGVWGKEMDISSFAANIAPIETFGNFLTDINYQIAFSSPYSLINTNQHLQFTLCPAQIRLPFWDFPIPLAFADQNLLQQKLIATSQLYDQVVALVPQKISSSPSAAPVPVCPTPSSSSNSLIILL